MPGGIQINRWRNTGYTSVLWRSRKSGNEELFPDSNHGVIETRETTRSKPGSFNSKACFFFKFFFFLKCHSRCRQSDCHCPSEKIEVFFNPLTYNIESYSWYKLRSRFERKSKLQTYEISNQILNLISLNWTLINKSCMQCFDTLNTLN